MLYWNKVTARSWCSKCFAPHVQMLYWNQRREFTEYAPIGSTCTNVVLKYEGISKGASIFYELHMYKCCIEISVCVYAIGSWICSTCTNVVLKLSISGSKSTEKCRSTCTNVVLKLDFLIDTFWTTELHMYKCCIEICDCSPGYKRQYAPHVQMLYWNRL